MMKYLGTSGQQPVSFAEPGQRQLIWLSLGGALQQVAEDSTCSPEPAGRHAGPADGEARPV